MKALLFTVFLGLTATALLLSPGAGLVRAQQQDFMGIPATGQRIKVEGMNFYRLKAGRVTDVWTQFDAVAMMQQLGAIPA